MKISDRTRDCAARICSVAACGGYFIFDLEDGRQLYGYRAIQFLLGSPGSAGDMALAAYADVMFRLRAADPDSEWTREVDAEAEAMIRSGWCP